MESNVLELYPFDYDQMQAVIHSAGLGLSAAELQGYQAGMLALDLKFDEPAWWSQFIEDYPNSQADSVQTEDRDALYSLLLHTLKGLESNAFEFNLLLPDDETSLILRVSMLAEWCAGFLTGVQTAMTLVDLEVAQKVEQSDQIKEILIDFSAIRQTSTLELNDVEDLLETERNYAEITEFVRVAVMNIYVEIILGSLDKSQDQTASSAAPNSLPTLH